MTINFDEKRSIYRKSVDCHIDFSEVGSSEKFKGDAKNLTAAGVNFITDHELTEGQELDVTVHPVIQKAKVAHVVKDEDSGKYIVGVSLEEVI
ncbi:MAG: PilZ domain-containing protein [Thiohalomonas sp.]|nr:PilZ domain-containing protein [Thiohalomonas sp.]